MGVQRWPGQAGRDRLPAHPLYRRPQRLRLRPVRLLPGLHDPRVHGRGHRRAGHRLLQDPRRRQALHPARGAAQGAASRPGRVLYSEDAALLRHGRCPGSPRLHVLLHRTVWRVRFVDLVALYRGRKTTLLPEPPGYLAWTNLCQEDGTWPLASQQEPPDHNFENHLNVKIPSKASSPNSPAATFSYLDINTKNDLFCFVRRVNSVACCSSPLRWWLIPKSMALHVKDCNSVFVAELLEIQIETINVNEERSL